MKLTTAVQEMHQLRQKLEEHLADAKKGEDELRRQIRERANILAPAEQGIDLDKVALAKTVIYVRGEYAKGGRDRDSVISDAISQLATGVPTQQTYSDLWLTYLGTKNYDAWSGQRSDHQYGYGPRHGSICFSVGVNSEIRSSRAPFDLTDEEVEAAIYYLTNIQRVQEAERKAASHAAA